MSEVRSFYLQERNIANPATYSLDDIFTTGFLNTPSGLGVNYEYSFVNFSNSYFPVGKQTNYPNIEGEMIFKTGYKGYKEFVDFCAGRDLSLVYTMPGVSGQYEKYVQLGSIEKTEIDYETNCLHAKVSFIAETPWISRQFVTSAGFKPYDSKQTNTTKRIENKTNSPMPIDIHFQLGLYVTDIRYNIKINGTNDVIGAGRFHNGGGFHDLKIEHAYQKPNVTSTYNDPNGPMAWQDFSYRKGDQWVFLTVPPHTTVDFVAVATYYRENTSVTENIGTVYIAGVETYDAI